MSKTNRCGVALRPLTALTLLAFGLAGCTTPAINGTAAYDTIQQTFEQGAQQRKPQQNTLNEALLPPMSADLPPLPKSVEPRFDLSVHSAAARQVFLALVADTPYSVVLPPDLSGQLTLSLKNVTVREALDTIRDMYGYEYVIQGRRIVIQPNTMQTRLYQVSYLATKRGGGSATRVTASNSSNNASSTPGGGTTTGATATEATTVYTGQASDFWFDLGQAMAITLNCEFDIERAAPIGGTTPAAASMAQALSQQMSKLKCPDGRNFVINKQSGVVMVRAMPAELRDIGRMLKAMQANIERQVMIEAKILEVELSEGFQSGINWAAFNDAGRHRWSNNANTDNIGFPSGYPVPPGGGEGTLTGTNGILRSFPIAGAIGLAFQSASFAAILSFLQTQGQVYVMSSPRIATLNNQKAVLKVGSDDYFVTAVTPPSYSSTGGTGSSNTVNPPTITAQPFFSGVMLDVTPQVDENGLITLHIKPAVSEVTDKEKVINFGTLGTYSLPYASAKVKETDSIVRVRDGMIVAIGGMMSQGQSNQSSRIPGLGDVPVASPFFKQTGAARGKREMVILLKPTVIRDELDWQDDLEATQDRLRAYDPRAVPAPYDPFVPR